MTISARMTRLMVSTIGAAAAIVLCAAIYYASLPRTADMTARPEVVIVLGKSGFSPRTAYISRGTRVTFKTSEGAPFWPASAVHPSHGVYPEFDPRRPLAADESWSFVFYKDGHWDFHDHLDATKTGVVIVIPPGEKASAKWDVLPPCDEADDAGRQSCWENHIVDAFAARGLDGAFDELKHLQESDQAFAGYCHNFAHEIGLLAYGAYGDDPPLSLRTGYCNDGFFHGYLEAFLTKHQDPQDARAFCDRVGRFFGGSFPSAILQCNHGIGHGTAEYVLNTRADLWNDLPKAVEIAVAACEETNADTVDRFRCASGAYDVFSDWMRLQPQYGEYWSLNHPFELCRSATDAWAQEACAREMAKLAILRTLDFDVARALPIVEERGRQYLHGKYLPQMLEGVVGLGAGRNGETDDAAIAKCHALSASMRESCIVGTAQGLFLKGVPDSEIPRVARFCLSPRMTKREQSACAAGLLTYVGNSYEALKVRDACGLLAPSVPSLEARCRALQ